ncbi:phage protein [Alicycliphilus sp. B1]|nr:phage protein [Alicycliphilus sp. B1]
MRAAQKEKGPSVAARGALTKKTNDGDFTLTTVRDEPRADTRLLAQHLGNQHKNVFELVKNYRADFENFGILRFQTEEIQGRGQPEKFALLNEDQAYLLLTYSRNTAKVRALKVKMVQAFRDARRAAEVRQVEYLPNYHAMHDAIKRAANGSPNERFMHMNANKELNRLAGVQPGQRASAGQLQQSILAVGCAMAAKAAAAAPDRHGLHQHIKNALKPLADVLTLPGALDASSAPALR